MIQVLQVSPKSKISAEKFQICTYTCIRYDINAARHSSEWHHEDTARYIDIRNITLKSLKHPSFAWNNQISEIVIKNDQFIGL